MLEICWLVKQSEFQEVGTDRQTDRQTDSRNPNIENLRVICMLMITILHALGHGGVLESYHYGQIGYYVFWLLEAICVVGVNVFVLISGFFGWRVKFTVSRIIRLWVEVELFSLLCLAIRGIIDSGFGISDLVFCFFSVTSKRYWFATFFILLLIIQPFLNIFINKIDVQLHKKIIAILITVFSIVPTFMPWSREALGDGMNLIWFVVLYFIGSYLGKYGIKDIINHRRLSPFAYYVIFVCLLFASNVLIGGGTTKLFGKVKGNAIFYNYNSLFVLIASVALFIAVISYKKYKFYRIAKIGKYCLGVYLISDHRIIRESLWSTFNIVPRAKGSVLLTLFWVAIAVVCIFFAGIVADWIIKKVIDRIPYRNADSLFDLGF